MTTSVAIIAHRKRIAALAEVVGQPVAARVGEHLDIEGIDALMETLRALPETERKAQIAEIATWSQQ
jgi:hypothetical protein